MIRSLGIISILALAACGGGRSDRNEPSVTRFASTTGPIASACMGSSRKGVNRATCGCIQMAADQTLTGSDQRRGASFFNDPERAHAVKLSDTTADDAFWKRWSEFGKAAEQLCK